MWYYFSSISYSTDYKLFKLWLQDAIARLDSKFSYTPDYPCIITITHNCIWQLIRLVYAVTWQSEQKFVSWEWLIIFYSIWSSLEFSLRRSGLSFQKVWTVFSLRRYGQSQNEKTPLIIITNENTRASCQNISFRLKFFIIILQRIIFLWKEIFFNVTWMCLNINS